MLILVQTHTKRLIIIQTYMHVQQFQWLAKNMFKNKSNKAGSDGHFFHGIIWSQRVFNTAPFTASKVPLNTTTHVITATRDST